MGGCEKTLAAEATLYGIMKLVFWAGPDRGVTIGNILTV